MKSLLFVLCVLVGCNYGKVPDYIKPLICKASDPQYETCLLNSFEKSRPYLMKGIRELSFPPMDPFILPLLTVNRTLDLVSISAICRNVRVEGARNIKIDSLKADPKKHSGEISLTVPWNYMEMEYEANGQLLGIPLESKGFFRGNFTNIQLYIKGGLTTYKKGGDEYFRVKKIDSKIVVGDGWINLLSKNPDLQIGADLITNFFNENPRRVMDTINPIFVESAVEIFRVIADQILSNVKVSEWLPA